MSHRRLHPSRASQCGWALVLVILSLFPIGTARAKDAPARANLALNKPATASSIENDEHNAARANDGDPRTSWRADDEPESGPEWWQVDLGTPVALAAGRIAFPYDGKNYQYKIEGSADGKTWRMLSDQTHTASRSRAQELTFEHAPAVRFVRVTIIRFDEGCWASISEVKLFGTS